MTARAPRIALDECLQGVGQRAGVQRMRLVTNELYRAVDVPADDQDFALGGLHAFAQRAKVFLAVDDPAEAACPTDEPAVVVVENCHANTITRCDKSATLQQQLIDSQGENSEFERNFLLAHLRNT